MRCAGEHRSELDEEKPPFRAVQGGAGKHSGESEAYTNLAGGWKEGTLPVGGGEAGGARVQKMWPGLRLVR